MTAAEEAETFFTGGAKTAKFEDRAYGTVIGGEIVADPEVRQQRDYETDELMFYPDGKPMPMMLVTVQAQPATDDDDGQRTLYIKGQLKSAVGDALRKVGAKAPKRGGRLWVKYLSDEPVTLKNGKRGNDKKIHAAKYEPPAAVAADGFYAEASPAAGRDTSPVARPERPDESSGLERPPAVDPAKWSAMSPDQQRQMYDALGLNATPTRSAAPAASGSGGGSRFDDEPPF